MVTKEPRVRILSAKTPEGLEEKVNGWFSDACRQIPGRKYVTNYSFTDNYCYAIIEYFEPVRPSPEAPAPTKQDPGVVAFDLGGNLDVRQATRMLEVRLINAALAKYSWHRTRAAKALGLSLRAVLYKIKDYQIVIPLDRPA